MDISEAKFRFDYDGEDFEIEVSNKTLKGLTWSHSSNPKFVYVVVHGLGSFITSNHDWFDVIISNEGAVVACDHIGHGRSPGPRVSCTVEEVIQETVKVIQFAKEKFPQVPVFLHGHSFGGLVVTTLMILRSEFVDENLAGVVVESPWISNSKQHKINQCLIGVLTCLDCAFPFLQIQTNSTPVQMMDPTYREMLIKHPFRSTTITPRLFLSVRSAQFFVVSHSDLYAQTPTLVLQSMDDTDVDPDGTINFFNKLSSKRKINLKIFDEGTHYLTKTKMRSRALNEILTFVQSLLPQ